MGYATLSPFEVEFETKTQGVEWWQQLGTLTLVDGYLYTFIKYTSEVTGNP